MQILVLSKTASVGEHKYQLEIYKISCVVIVCLCSTFHNSKVMINKAQHFSKLGRPKGCRVRKQMEEKLDEKY